MNKLIYFVAFLLFCGSSFAQILKPVKWSFRSERLSAEEAVLIMEAKIDKNWHLYSQFIPADGPVPTSFRFENPVGFTTQGAISETPAPVKVYDSLFMMDILWFEKKATFRQKIKLKSPEELTVKGILEFMVCDDKQCLPPEELEFTIKVEAFKGENAIPAADPDSINRTTGISLTDTVISNAELAPQEKTGYALWEIFIGGFFGGFLALLMPCIFPMIPLTVSFFTKKGGSRRKGIQQAVTYGISIVAIYVTLGLGITLAFGADALNDMASNAVFNLLFFVILMIFAFSFLGAFEITIPSRFVNKVDSHSEKGGLLGIFFMAFTLALVSFSCTGPIIGNLLVVTATGGVSAGPLVGMTGFSLALAIPFTLFAVFPGWMKSLPKSGGWLNSVKVVLGFLELALALKFLSNVDLAYHWGILDREVFLVLWIMIFVLMGFYLLGKLRFSHDSEVNYVSIPRLLLAIVSFAFALYMVPGLWGAPLKAISAFAPPQATQDFDLHTNAGSGSGPVQAHGSDKKYASLFHCPHNLDCFFDYDEGMEYAKKTGKPVMVDFTGHSCVNCRKMEASVWSAPEVLKRLRDEYVLISLYVDDKTELPDHEKYVSSFSGKKIKSIGNKWSDIQGSKYGTNSQPYYVLLDHNGELLVEPQAFNLNVDNYVRFLDSGLEAFRKK